MNMRKFLKILVAIIFFGGFCLFISVNTLYPTLICKGEYSKQRDWTSKNKLSTPKKLDDERLNLSYSVLIRRDAITIEKDRFPFYKELSSKNNFAKRDDVGISGGYVNDYIQHQKYNFNYNKITNQLTIELNGHVKHLINDEIGTDVLKVTFLGNCERKWF